MRGRRQIKAAVVGQASRSSVAAVEREKVCSDSDESRAGGNQSLRCQKLLWQSGLSSDANARRLFQGHLFPKSLASEGLLHQRCRQKLLAPLWSFVKSVLRLNSTDSVL